MISDSAVPPAVSALEDPSFPFEVVSVIAELESWRKEINRPIYHLHKWWAQRLGSVFRAILIGALTDDPVKVMDMFYRPVRFPDATIFDPFMGSGTTIGEALKLGCRAIGRDINPVPYLAVKNALRNVSRDDVLATFHAIERDVAPRIRRYYLVPLETGEQAEVLYYFWVKYVACPSCGASVDLFSSYIFARHAYPHRNPDAKALCPNCGAINSVRYDAERATCVGCTYVFNPQTGPVQKSMAVCPQCSASFSIVRAIRLRNGPPEHRLYAKLVLMPDGTKAYLKADESDRVLYQDAAQALAARQNAYPVVPIEEGYNTAQVRRYQYYWWHQMFNHRQLLGLSLLAERIKAIEDLSLRELFTCLFSSVLEFNNLFASYKGEGTGAVRHMFSHHILKPERTPLEANLWGTPKSSGAFSTLFRTRLLRALEYRDNPFEILPVIAGGRVTSKKVYGISAPLSQSIVGSYDEFRDRGGVYLSCGDSSRTDLPDESVTLIVTDPPFFDNVHYSELADFFYVWQRHILDQVPTSHGTTTRAAGEVQSRDADLFARRLGDVFAECHRVLRADGLLVFTYHHARSEGWFAVLSAIVNAGFVVTAAVPVKSELSRATPKQQTHHPIDIDVIFSCRKRCAASSRRYPRSSMLLTKASQVAKAQVARLARTGRRLSRNDVRVVLMAQVVTLLSQTLSIDNAREWLRSRENDIDAVVEDLFAHAQIISKQRPLVAVGGREHTWQLSLPI